MKIQINGEIESVSQEDLSIISLLEMKQVESPEMVSVQLNGEIINSNKYGVTFIADNDEVDFLYFMGGGS